MEGEEVTKLLKDIRDELRDFPKILSSTNKALVKNVNTEKEADQVKKKAKRTMFDFYQSVKKATSPVENFGDEVTEATEELNDFEKKLKGIPGPMGLLKMGLKKLYDATVATTVAFAKTALAFARSDSNIKGFEDAVSKGIVDLGVFGDASGFIAKELDVNIDMFKGLARSGANFNGSLAELRASATAAGMPLVQFQALIQNNTSTLARLFGSVNQGIPNIVELGKGLRELNKKELAIFGISMEDTNEFLGTQMELMRAQGRAEQMDAQTLLKITGAYARNLTTLSKLTGESAQELDKQRRERALDGVLQAKLAQMSIDEQENVNNILSMFPAAAQTAIKELLLLNVPISEAARGLSVLAPGIRNTLVDAVKSGGQLTKEQLVELSNSIKTTASEVQGSKIADAFATAAMVGGEAFAKESLDIVAAVAGSAADIEKVVNQNIDPATQKLVNVANTMDENTVAMQDVISKFMDNQLFDTDSAGYKLLSGFVDGSSQKLQEILNKMYEMLGMANPNAAYAPPSESGKKKDGSFLSNLFGFNKPRTYGGIEDYGDTIEFDRGSRGFQNFGGGTPAVLHGMEAVVPENTLLGNAISYLEAIAKKPSGTAGELKRVDTNTAPTTDITTLSNQLNDLVKTNTNSEMALNRLLATSMMTEKNTKETKNSLAGMGSIV